MAEVGVFVGAEGGGGDSVELHFLHDGFRCGLNVSWASPLKSYRFTIFHGICHSIYKGRKSLKNSASDAGCVAHACLCGSDGCGGDGAIRHEARRGFVQAARGFRGGWRVFGRRAMAFVGGREACRCWLALACLQKIAIFLRRNASV